MSRAFARVAVAAALAATVAACSGSLKQTPRSRMSTKEIVTRNKPSVVRIESRFGGPNVGYGTGFVVKTGGIIATNLHVIAGSRDIKVKLFDGSEHSVRRVLAYDPQRDLAIISIDKQDLPVIHLGNSDEVSAGDPVISIGNPLGVFDYTVSDGLISSVRPLDANITVLQISAPISQGSSGGPLFNNYGEVIGIATFISVKGQNLNFGVPSNYLRRLMQQPSPGQPLAEFAARFRPPDGEGSGVGRGGGRERNIPDHPISVLDGCSADQVTEVFRSITEAIEIGAPVYNRGEHEACFVIYRKVAEKFESDPKVCKGVRDAFGQGLLRAETQDSFTDKAWAIRDTFDGMVDVIGKKAGAGPGGR